MSADTAFFEFRGEITNRGHAEDQGEPVHCIVKMMSLDAQGKRRRNVDLEQQAGDTVLFVLNPGPHRKMSHSSIRAVGEEILTNAGPPVHVHRVGIAKSTVTNTMILTRLTSPGVNRPN